MRGDSPVSVGQSLSFANEARSFGGSGVARTLLSSLCWQPLVESHSGSRNESNKNIQRKKTVEAMQEINARSGRTSVSIPITSQPHQSSLGIQATTLCRILSLVQNSHDPSTPRIWCIGCSILVYITFKSNHFLIFKQKSSSAPPRSVSLISATNVHNLTTINRFIF